MRATAREIDYRVAPYGHIATIPKGTPVAEATNLPPEKKRYWCEPWEGMTEQEESWERNYGFLIEEDEVEEVG